MKRALVQIAVLLAFLLALGGSYWLGGVMARRGRLEPEGRPDTVYVDKWIEDTTKEVESTRPSGTMTATLPVHINPTEIDTLSTPGQIYPDTSCVNRPDSVTVDIPIEERTYVGENYRATVRGYQPELTDIWIKRSERIITMPYRKRWGITVGPQAGVGITPEGWRPYVGIGVTFGYSF